MQAKPAIQHAVHCSQRVSKWSFSLTVCVALTHCSYTAVVRSAYILLEGCTLRRVGTTSNGPEIQTVLHMLCINHALPYRSLLTSDSG